MNIKNLLELVRFFNFFSLDYFPIGYVLSVFVDKDNDLKEFVFYMQEFHSISISLENLKELFDLIEALNLDFTIDDGLLSVIYYNSDDSTQVFSFSVY